MVKFMILSDTHNFDRESASPCPLTQPLPKVDVVLHCGDLTSVGGIASYKKALRMLGQFEAELKLVIAGNHDLSLDGDYWRSHPREGNDPTEHDQALAIMTGDLAKAAGVTYLEEGERTFMLQNGKTFKIFASPYQPEFCDWAFAYSRDEGERRWNIPKDVDIVMTHGPPEGVLDLCGNGHVGCKGLLEEVEWRTPLMHCFGHIHEGYGVERKIWGSPDDTHGELVTVSKAGVDGWNQDFKIAKGKSTLMVNAAIMDEKYRPVNAPWIVELPL